MGGAVSARRANRQRGGQNKIVVTWTCRWHGVFILGRVATLGSGGLATLGCGVNEGGTLGGDIGSFGGQNNFEVAWNANSRRGETLGKFGG